MRVLVFLFFSFFSFFVHSQSVQHVSFSQQGNRVEVSFHLSEVEKAENIHLKLLYSTNGGKKYKVCNAVKYKPKEKKHTLIWTPKADGISNLKGDNIKFKVQASFTKRKGKLPKRNVTREDYVETVGGISFKMIYVPGGVFKLGDNTTKQIILDGYWIGETEVTQELFKYVMGVNFSTFRGNDHPVERIPWNATIDRFIVGLNKHANKSYNLPTEAQWEFAARGGAQGVLLETLTPEAFRPEDNLNAKAWNSENSSRKTHPVKTKQPNSLGLYDMRGNVWEWCLDTYSEEFILQEGTSKNPVNTIKGDIKVIRGGSWKEGAKACDTKRRGRLSFRSGFNRVGFRLVRNVGAGGK